MAVLRNARSGAPGYGQLPRARYPTRLWRDRQAVLSRSGASVLEAKGTPHMTVKVAINGFGRIGTRNVSLRHHRIGGALDIER